MQPSSFVAWGQGDDKEYDLIDLARTVRLGDSAVLLAAKLSSGWTLAQTNTALGEYPFNTLVPYTNSAVVSEWRPSRPTSVSRRWILFAVFANSEKTNLVDLLWFQGPLRPLVDGIYNRNLLSIKKGDSIDKVYALLGTRDCEYYRDKQRHWRVRFSWFACDGSSVDVEADAGSALVVSVGHGYL